MFTGQDVEISKINWGVRVERAWHEEFYLPEGERSVSLAKAYSHAIGCDLLKEG